MAIFFLPDHLLNESSNVKNTYMVGYLDSVLSILRSDIKVYERYEIINKYYFFMTRRTYNNLIKAYNEKWSDLPK